MTVRILLIDLSALYWTLWHASKGEASSIAYDRTIMRIEHEAAQYDHVGICCDSPKCFRKEIDPNYKAQREAKPTGAIEQLQRVVRTLKARGHHILVAEGFEGDDIIATAVTWALDAIPECDITILGADKDLYALLDDQVRIHNHQTGQMFGTEDLWAKAKIRPHQVPEYLALTGDGSDNVAGVTGVGAKTATALLNQYNSLDGIFDAVVNNVTSFGGKKALVANLVADEENARNALKLTTLRTDAPIECSDILQPITPIHQAEEGPPPMDEGEPIESTSEDAPPDEAPAQSQPRPSEPEQQAAPEASAGEMQVAPRAVGGSALARTEEWTLQLEPRGMKGAWWVAQQLIQSGMFRKKFTHTTEALVAIMAGRERGMGVFQAMDNIDIVEGNPRFKSRAIIGMARSFRECEYLEPVLDECDATKAVWRTKRRGRPEQRHTYTIEDAELAGLVRTTSKGKANNWMRIPKPMLRKQAGVELAREIYPEVCAGVYSTDELIPQEYVVEAEEVA